MPEPIDWKSPLAFEDAGGRHPARFHLNDSDGTTVRVRVYGKKFASVYNQATWWTGIRADKATGKSLTLNWPGKIVNVPEDLLGDLDPATGQPATMLVSEHKRLQQEAVQQAVTAALAAAGQSTALRDLRIVLETDGGSAKVVSVSEI